MNNIIRKIYVTFEKEGIHCYPEAATDPKLSEVSFLQFPHRHIFKFRVEIEVEHNNRAIEFIIFKRWLENIYGDNIYGDGTLQLNHKSCEMLAEELIEAISCQYPNRNIAVEVSEDGENGCRLEFNTSSSQQITLN